MLDCIFNEDQVHVSFSYLGEVKEKLYGKLECSTDIITVNMRVERNE